MTTNAKFPIGQRVRDMNRWDGAVREVDGALFVVDCDNGECVTSHPGNLKRLRPKRGGQLERVTKEREEWKNKFNDIETALYEIRKIINRVGKERDDLRAELERVSQDRYDLRDRLRYAEECWNSESRARLDAQAERDALRAELERVTKERDEAVADASGKAETIERLKADLEVPLVKEIIKRWNP